MEKLTALAGEAPGVFGLRVLSSLEVGESGTLVAMDLPPGVQNHLMYMGFVPDTQVKAVRRAPSGDPTVYLVDGIEIALRHETARAIQVTSVWQGTGAVDGIAESVEPESGDSESDGSVSVEEWTEAIR